MRFITSHLSQERDAHGDLNLTSKSLEVLENMKLSLENRLKSSDTDHLARIGYENDIKKIEAEIKKRCTLQQGDHPQLHTQQRVKEQRAHELAQPRYSSVISKTELIKKQRRAELEDLAKRRLGSFTNVRTFVGYVIPKFLDKYPRFKSKATQEAKDAFRQYDITLYYTLASPQVTRNEHLKDMYNDLKQLATVWDGTLSQSLTTFNTNQGANQMVERDICVAVYATGVLKDFIPHP